MSSDTSRTAIWALGGAIVGWFAGRGGTTNYSGLANLIGQVVPEAAAIAPWGYGRCHGGHSAAPFIMYDTERRLAGLEAEAAANAAMIRSNTEKDRLRSERDEARTDFKIFRNTCLKVDGRVYCPPSHLADAYRGASRVLDSHPAGCGDCESFY